MFELKKLDNGIRVLCEHSPESNIAAMAFTVKTGVINEYENVSGISHFVEHMLFKGTKNRKAVKISEDMDMIGGHINAFTSHELTCFHFKSISSRFMEGVEVLTDMFVNSTFPEDEIEKERKVILEEMAMSKDSPDDYIFEEGSKLVMRNTPYGKSIIGNKESLANIYRKELVEYVAARYTKDNILVVIAGNYNEDEIFRFLNRELNVLNEEKQEKELEFTDYYTGFFADKRNIEQTHIFLAAPTHPLNHRLVPAIKVVSNILGGSMSSRLFVSIREEKGLAYVIHDVVGHYSMGGCNSIYLGISHDNIEKALSAIKLELDKMKKHGVTEKEIEKAKNQIMSGYLFSQESVLSRMFGSMRNLLLQDQLISEKELLKKYEEITANDICEAIDLISNPDMYSVAILSNKYVDIENIWKKS